MTTKAFAAPWSAGGAAALVVATQLACTSARPSAFDQFTVPPETFFETTHTIALFSLSTESDVAVPPCVDSIAEHALTQWLAGAGFTVIPSFVQQEIWQRITEDAGGFYDPITGELDEDRFEAGVTQFRAELNAKAAPDAILYPHIWVVEVQTIGGKAMWDGVSESVSHRLGGIVSVLSYVIAIEDPNGVSLFVNGGGLQALERWDASSREIVSVPAEELCAEPRRIVEAVEIALAPLTQHSSDQPPR